MLEDDEWLAIKEFKVEKPIDKKDKLSIIVAINNTENKIIVVSRAHNRIVSDDENTKQWYGIFTIESFYYQVHSQVLCLNQDLDAFLPEDLRPQMSQSLIFQQKPSFKTQFDNDEDISNLIENYLYKIFYTIGRQLFLEIVFNDHLEEGKDKYFESYSIFNFNKMEEDANKVKEDLNKCVNDCKATVDLKVMKKNYTFQEQLLKKYFEINDELFNMKQKPLLNKRETLKMMIQEAKKVLEDMAQYGEKIIEKANLNINQSTGALYKLSIEIDQLYMDYKMKFIERYEFLVKIIKNDIARIKNNQFTSFAVFRLNEYEEELYKKKIQYYDLEMKILKTKEENLCKTKSNSEDVDKLRLKIFNCKINVLTEKENRVKMKLKKYKTNVEQDINEIIVEEIFEKEEEKRKECFKKLIETQMNGDSDSNDEDFKDANDDENEFFEAAESDRMSMISTSYSSKFHIASKKPNVEEANLKIELLDLGREKSSIRNKMTKLTEKMKKANEEKLKLQQEKEQPKKNNLSSDDKNTKKTYVPNSQKTIIPSKKPAKKNDSINTSVTVVPTVIQEVKVATPPPAPQIGNLEKTTPPPPPPPMIGLEKVIPPPPLMPILAATVPIPPPISILTAGTSAPPPPPPPPMFPIAHNKSVELSKSSKPHEIKTSNPVDELNKLFAKGFKLKPTAAKEAIKEEEDTTTRQIRSTLEEALKGRREFISNHDTDDSSGDEF